MAPTASAPEPEILLVPTSSLLSKPWWPALHSTINLAYDYKSIQAFPPSWTRLNPDPNVAGAGLTHELGSAGHMVVLFLDDRPVAAAGLLPFRGLDWMTDFDSHMKQDEHAPDAAQTAATVTKGELTTTDPPEPALQSHRASSSEGIEEWEVCTFCTHPKYRGRALAEPMLQTMIDFIRPQGAKRLYSAYVNEATGKFWPRMGFERITSVDAVLPKGFSPGPGVEGLREELHVRLAVRAL